MGGCSWRLKTNLSLKYLKIKHNLSENTKFETMAKVVSLDEKTIQVVYYK